MLLLALHAAALAAPPVEVRPYPFEKAAPVNVPERSFEVDVGLRYHAMSVPDAVLDRWYFDSDEPNWAWIDPRPAATMRAIGLQAEIDAGPLQGTFWSEFIDSTVVGGYWDDREDVPNHLDGKFLVPTDGFGAIAAGGTLSWDGVFLPSEQTRGAVELAFRIGGGVGLGVVTGHLQQWNADDFGNPSYKRQLDGLPADGSAGFPPIVPIVDALAGLRVGLGERLDVVAQGGIHGALAWGLTADLSL